MIFRAIRGKLHGMSLKLSTRNLHIVDLFRSGLTGRAIAGKVGLTYSQVSRIILRDCDDIAAVRIARKLAVALAKERRRIHMDGERFDSFCAKFHAKIKQSEQGCREWNGMIQHCQRPGTGGYGVCRMSRTVKDRLGLNSREYAHRVAYAMAKGRIPSGMTVDHICFNRRCCNPDHLQLLTRQQNSSKKRRNACLPGV